MLDKFFKGWGFKMSVNLSPEQTHVYDQIMRWHKTKEQCLVVDGSAGTGKSTLAKLIADQIGQDKVTFLAGTGKAANVLREKGCQNVSTVHSAIYKFIGEEEDQKPRFAFNKKNDIRKAELVILDEGFMEPDHRIADLKKSAKKILIMGDSFQLPPVEGTCSLKADLRLTQVHRQALDSGIIRAATAIREGRKLQFCNEPDFVYQPKSKIPQEAYLNADQVIVGYNRTRDAWNDRFRQVKGYTGLYPQKGEKLICRRNNHAKGLLNGMIGNATRNARHMDDEQLNLWFDNFDDLTVWDGDFRKSKEAPKQRFINRFQYADVITCHLGQGSEFDDVVGLNEPIGKTAEERARWLYTLVTRAKKHMTLGEPS